MRSSRRAAWSSPRCPRSGPTASTPASVTRPATASGSPRCCRNTADHVLVVTPRSADRDGRFAGGLHAFGEPHRLLDQRLDDLRLGHGLDDLAAHEDLALPVAGRHAEIGLARLTRT